MNIKKVIIFIFSISVLLSGCKLTNPVNSSISDEEKAIIYKAFFKDIPNRVKSYSYYMYEVHFDDMTFSYQIYNREGFMKYVFIGGSREQINLDIDNQYAFLNIESTKDSPSNVLRTEVNDLILNYVKEYEIAVDSLISNLELESLETTEETHQKKYYIDYVVMKTYLDGEEYTASTTYYINDHKEVRMHDDLNVLIMTTFRNNQKMIDLTLYEGKDVSERDEYEYIDVSSDEFIQVLNQEIEKIKS